MTAITLTAAQGSVYRSKARFRIVCAGRRFGKTFLALVIMLYAVCRPDAKDLTIWYVAPTYRQAKEIAWKLLKRLTPLGWTQKINETDLSIEFKNGCVLALRGADNPDSLRGVGLDGLVLDEFADMGPDAWFEVLRPALADKGGWALFIGTPRGYNHFHDMWIKAHGAEGWQAFQFTTADGGNVSPEELASAQAEMDERTFRQEFKASFETLAGRVYQAFERSVHVRSDVVDVPSLPLLVGMDFNVNPMSAVLAVMPGGQLHVFGEIEIPNGNTELMVKEIRRRYPERAIQVYPDPSGQARKTSAPVGQTDFSLIKEAKMRIIAPSAAPAVVDRVNEVNAIFRNAAGDIRCFVGPTSKVLIKGLEGLTWKQGTSSPDKSLGLDHMPDAFGYLVHSEYPLVKRISTMKELRL